MSRVFCLPHNIGGLQIRQMSRPHVGMFLAGMLVVAAAEVIKSAPCATVAVLFKMPCTQAGKTGPAHLLTPVRQNAGPRPEPRAAHNACTSVERDRVEQVRPERILWGSAGAAVGPWVGPRGLAPHSPPFKGELPSVLFKLVELYPDELVPHAADLVSMLGAKFVGMLTGDLQSEELKTATCGS